MGFSTTGAFALLALSVFVSASILYGAGSQYVEDIGESTREPTKQHQEIKNTNFNITGASFDGTDTNITIENTGQTTIEKDELTLMVDANYQAPSNWSMSPTVIHPTETATISINMDSNRVLIVHDTGLKEGSDVA